MEDADTSSLEKMASQGPWSSLATCCHGACSRAMRMPTCAHLTTHTHVQEITGRGGPLSCHTRSPLRVARHRRPAGVNALDRNREHSELERERTPAQGQTDRAWVRAKAKAKVRVRVGVRSQHLRGTLEVKDVQVAGAAAGVALHAQQAARLGRLEEHLHFVRVHPLAHPPCPRVPERTYVRRRSQVSGTSEGVWVR